MKATSKKSNKKSKLIIFDTTLRDGEQSPGCAMTLEQKVQFALQLQALRVDVIEAGFPISSKTQFEAVEKISQAVKSTTIAGLCRAMKADIDSAAKALQKAKKKRIHTFIATSDIHMKYKLGKSRSEVIKMATDAVAYAKKFTPDVEFSAEDAARSDLLFLKEIVEAVIEAGATTINLPDTVGYTTPLEYAKLFQVAMEAPNSDQAIFSTHCHNDLGLAVANSLSAVTVGARQVECAVNGIGERAGNASLEEVVMAVKTRKDYYNLDTGVNIKEIYKTSRHLTYITGMQVQPNKAIVGKNAFSHESGIHQHGMIKNKSTYEIIKPESIGRKEGHLVLGRHSGKHGLSASLKKMGITIDKKNLEQVYSKFIEIADKKKEIFEEDLMAILKDTLHVKANGFVLNLVTAVAGSGLIASATVRVSNDGKDYTAASTGDGPVDSVYNAIDSILYDKNNKFGIPRNELTLKEYDINSITGGTDAIGEVKVLLLDKKENEYYGHGYSTDIIEASGKAYIHAINNYLRRKTKRVKALNLTGV